MDEELAECLECGNEVDASELDDFGGMCEECYLERETEE